MSAEDKTAHRGLLAGVFAVGLAGGMFVVPQPNEAPEIRQILASEKNEAKALPEKFEELTFSEFSKDLENAKDRNIFLGRNFRVTLESNTNVVRAVMQQRVLSETGEILINYIIQSGPNKFIVVAVPQGDVGTDPGKWPVNTQIKAERFIEKTVLELEGRKGEVEVQDSENGFSKVNVPIIIARKIILPKPEKIPA